jgi:hypothetical protein
VVALERLARGEPEEALEAARAAIRLDPLATLPAGPAPPAAQGLAALSSVPVVWAGLLGLVLFNGVAVVLLRLSAEAWRGRPVSALAEFAAVPPGRTALRDADVAGWLVVVRAWTVLAAVAAAIRLLPEPWLAAPARAVLGAAALAVPMAVAAQVALTRRRRGLLRLLRAVAARDRSLAAAVPLLGGMTAGVLVMAGAPLHRVVAGWAGAAGWAVLGAGGAIAVLLAVRGLWSWWRGAPGPWRGSLVPSEDLGFSEGPGPPGVPGDVRPSPGLDDDVRRALAGAREVVLAYADASGPRALAIAAVASVSPAGELGLIAPGEAWEAALRDPRVALFVADPARRRWWAEVRGIALGDPRAEMLRVTPKQVLVGEYPGRHQRR